jgi:hypothetical protein
MGFENLRVYKAAELLDREVKTLLADLTHTDDVKQLLRAHSAQSFTTSRKLSDRNTLDASDTTSW